MMSAETKEWKCTCLESNRDVLSVIYDPNGNAMTHGDIVSHLNDGISLTGTNMYLEHRIEELVQLLQLIAKEAWLPPGLRHRIEDAIEENE